jgi:hypothetical protein
MFDWLHPQPESPELEHAKQRQEERNAALHRDPLEEYEYIVEEGLEVEEISPEEFQRQLEIQRKPGA